MIKEWTQKEWNQHRKELQDIVHAIPMWEDAFIKRGTKDGVITITNGPLQVAYDERDNADNCLKFWSAASSYPGMDISFGELRDFYEKIQKWYGAL